jgi:ribonuclease BN (tRNA processing enzyme)
VRITVVGCSGSLPGPASPASCYLVEADGVAPDGSRRTWRLVLDLGSGALGPLQRYTSVRDVDAVALSHLHPDHCLDMCGVYVALRYDPRGSRPDRLTVLGPQGTAERLASAYGLPVDPGMTGELDVRHWSPGTPVAVGPMTVTPHPVLHPVPAFGLRVEGPAEDHQSRAVALGYSGDTDTCAGLTRLADGVDVLLAEASFTEGRDTQRGVHLTGRRAGEAAAAGGVGRLVLTHLPPWNEPVRCLDEARAVFAGPVQLAEPGLVVLL